MSLYRSDFEPRRSEEFQALRDRMVQGAGLFSDRLLLELNAWLGLARACAHSARVQAILLTLQTDLRQVLQRATIFHNQEPSPFLRERIRWLEETRETLERERSSRELPELPGDTVSGAILDLLSIMAQRMGHELLEKMERADPGMGEYLERLPVLLFALARYEEDQADPDR